MYNLNGNYFAPNGNLLFGSGANSNIARFLGKKEYGKVNEYSSTPVFTGIAAITVLVVGMLLFVESLLKLLGATEGYSSLVGFN